MKQRLITTIAILIIFIPLLLVDSLFPLFQILMLVLTIIGTWEMLKMYDKEKTIPLTMKIITIICALVMYLAVLVELDPRSIPNQTLMLFNIKLKFLPTTILILLILFKY